MKKINIILSLIALVVLLLPVAVLALYTGYPAPTTATSVTDLIVNIGKVIWMVFVFLAVVCFVYAGIMFLTSGGKPDKVGLAKSAAIFGVVGIVVAILAYSIVSIIGNALSGNVGNGGGGGGGTVYRCNGQTCATNGTGRVCRTNLDCP